MRPRRLSFAALLAVAIVLPATAGVPRADIDLSWLSGAWCGGGEGERIEETWLPPVAGQLVGMSRTVRGEQLIGYEFMRIGPGNDGVPAFFAQPNGKPPTEFPASDAGEDWIRFENAHHDFPQRVEYRRVGEELHATIAGPGEGGKPLAIEFAYRRCAG